MVVHERLDALVTAAPLTVCVDPWQMVPSDPALAVGGARMVRVSGSETVEQGALPIAVRVSTTEPVEISEAPGV